MPVVVGPLYSSATRNAGAATISYPAPLVPSALPDEMVQLLCAFLSGLGGTRIEPPLPGEGLELSFSIVPKTRGA